MAARSNPVADRVRISASRCACDWPPHHPRSGGCSGTSFAQRHGSRSRGRGGPWTRIHGHEMPRLGQEPTEIACTLRRSPGPRSRRSRCFAMRNAAVVGRRTNEYRQTASAGWLNRLLRQSICRRAPRNSSCVGSISSPLCHIAFAFAASPNSRWVRPKAQYTSALEIPVSASRFWSTKD